MNDKMTLYDKIKKIFKNRQTIKEYQGYFQTLCVFHKENTPSLTVYKDHFYCFGCQRTGNLEYLWFFLTKNKVKDDRKYEKKQYSQNSEYSEQEYDFSEILEFGNEDKGYEYLLSRKIHPEIAIRKCFYFGKTTQEMKERFEKQFPFLFSDGKFFFEYCYVFPFIQNGKVIYLQGKDIINGKYKNIPKLKKPIYLPYGYLNARRIYVCEGVIDTLSMETLLLFREETESQAIGILGVQSWRVLFSLPTDLEIILSLDNDIPGCKATFEAYRELRKYFQKVGVFEDTLHIKGFKSVKDINDYLNYMYFREVEDGKKG